MTASEVINLVLGSSGLSIAIIMFWSLPVPSFTQEYGGSAVSVHHYPCQE